MEREGFQSEQAEPQSEPVARELETVMPREAAALASADTEDQLVTQEISRSELLEARAKEPEPLHFEKLPKEEQYQIIDQLLEGMREAIGPVKEYAVFASTAMYLNGENIVKAGDKRGRDLMQPPGDFDVAVFKLEDLDAIRERLRSMPDVIFANAKKDRDGQMKRDAEGKVVYDGEPGDYGTFPGQDTQILAGQRVFDVELDGKKEKVAYEFEIFLNTRVVPQRAARELAVESHGLRVLDLEGLKEQYQRNYDYEVKVDEHVNKTVAELHKNTPEAKRFKAEILGIQSRDQAEAQDIEEGDDIALTDETRAELEKLDVGARAMKRAFEIQAELDATEAKYKVPFAKLNEEGIFERYVQALIDLDNEEKAQEIVDAYRGVQKLVSERATLLAGTKTKLAKRSLNLLQLDWIKEVQQ